MNFKWYVATYDSWHFDILLQTTHENFRCHDSNKENPYNEGIVKNIKEILFSKIPPSLNDFRALVQEDQVTVVETKFLPIIISSIANSDVEKGAM